MMKSNPFSVAHAVRIVLVAAGLCLAAGNGMAADGGKGGNSATFAQEHADCMAGNTGQDRATCLREAGAAKQESRRGNLRDSGDYGSNASKRCAALPAAEKADCERRAKGEGSVSGSVESGGVVRELVTPVPASK